MGNTSSYESKKRAAQAATNSRRGRREGAPSLEMEIGGRRVPCGYRMEWRRRMRNACPADGQGGMGWRAAEANCGAAVVMGLQCHIGRRCATASAAGWGGSFEWSFY
ncbi:hypothetical protein D9M72_639740 [compost metagenome]